MPEHEMTPAQSEAYDQGYDDRCGRRLMRESWTLAPHVANAYLNGYRDACEGFAQDAAAAAAEKAFGC